MDQLIPTFEALKLKASNIEEAMIVMPHKVKLIEDVCELSKENKVLVSLQSDIENCFQAHNEILMKEYGDTNKIIHRTQLKMMLLIQHLEDKEKHELNQKRALQQIAIPGTPKLVS